MRAVVRPSTMFLSLLLAGALAPLATQAQTDPNQPYQQPGYQQPQGYPDQQPYQQPQQYPQQPQQYPQQPYQQPQQYPQQPYQQPQPYPQQQYQQPQPYPQQGYAPQGTPPGYYAPQPAYGQQPTYAPPPAYAPPPVGPPAYRRGFLLMPYLGVNVPVGDTSSALSTGLRLGGLMGAMVGPFVSLNGELTIDILNPDTPSGVSVTEMEADLTFSPLFHLSLPGLELVAGPKIGFFAYTASVSYSSGVSDATYSGSGVAYGFNTGVFIPIVGRLAIGGLLGYTIRSFANCDSSSTDCYSGPDDKFFSFTGAMIF